MVILWGWVFLMSEVPLYLGLGRRGGEGLDAEAIRVRLPPCRLDLGCARGLGFGVWGFEVWVLGFGHRVQGVGWFGVWVWGCGVWG